MGCTSSSLKGDDVNMNSQQVNISQSANEPASQPMKKVRTNFSDVDYDSSAQQRRLTEYAPHEQPPPTIREMSHDLSAEQQRQEHFETTTETYHETHQHHQSSAAGTSTAVANDEHGEAHGEHLKPYQTIDGDEWDKENEAPPISQHHHVGSQEGNSLSNGYHESTTLDTTDPTSASAKDEFARENDPANPHYHHHNNTNNNSTHQSPTESAEITDSQHKKSWLGQRYADLQSAKRGPGVSDEDIEKYTGKTREELEGMRGIGGEQGAGRVGTDNNLAGSAPWS
jgi:hypothetical protein